MLESSCRWQPMQRLPGRSHRICQWTRFLWPRTGLKRHCQKNSVGSGFVAWCSMNTPRRELHQEGLMQSLIEAGVRVPSRCITCVTDLGHNSKVILGAWHHPIDMMILKGSWRILRVWSFFAFWIFWIWCRTTVTAPCHPVNTLKVTLVH